MIASMKTHQGFISCIRRFPPEVLGEIFVQCLPGDTYIHPGPDTVPLLLTGICKGWRQVALSTARLWCSLRIGLGPRRWQVVDDDYDWKNDDGDVDSDPDSYGDEDEDEDESNGDVEGEGEDDQGDDPEGDQEILSPHQNWLSRARGCPLSLAVDVRRREGDIRFINKVADFMQSYAGQLVRLRLVFNEATGPALILKDVPMLEHLTLDGRVKVWGAQKISITQPQPLLRSVTLNSYFFNPDILSLFDPGWENLTRIKDAVFVSSCQALLALLQHCPNLEDLIFSTVITRGGHDTTHPLGTLRHQKLLSLDLAIPGDIGHVLNPLTLPNLRHLKISTAAKKPNIPYPWQQDKFEAFISRSRCPLETLKIDGTTRGSTKDRHEFIALIPTLKHLDLSLSTGCKYWCQ